MEIPSAKEVYIAVRADWYSKYITSSMGTVNDCYIYSIEDNWSKFKPLGEPFQKFVDDEHEGNQDDGIDDGGIEQDGIELEVPDFNEAEGAGTVPN